MTSKRRIFYLRVVGFKLGMTMKKDIELKLGNSGISTRFSYEVHLVSGKTFCLIADTCSTEHRSVTNAMSDVLSYLFERIDCDVFAYRDSEGNWAVILLKDQRLAGFKYIRGQNHNCAFIEIPYLILAQDLRAA